MGSRTTTDDRRMTLTIPVDGLDEVRRVWAGRGGLWAAVAAADSYEGGPWTPELARRRAARVIAELLRPQLLRWPDSRRKWIDALPAQSVRHHLVADAPGAGMDWVATRTRGWPPREFHHRLRSRVPDTLLITVARWAIESLASIVSVADGIDPAIVGPEGRARMQVALMMLDREPLASSHPAVPSHADLVALRSSGRPWNAVASVASWLRILDHDPNRLAQLPIDPDPVLAERLFHVAILGLVFKCLRDAGWTLYPTGLPGSPDGGPVFALTDPSGDTWDLWYEMAGAWSYYGVPAPYASAVTGVPGTGGPLGCDIAIVRHGDRAVMIECKFSADPTYVGRAGYEQTLAYMAEALSGVALSVSGIVVGPSEVVNSGGMTDTSVGVIRVTNPDELSPSITDAIQDATAALLR